MEASRRVVDAEQRLTHAAPSPARRFHPIVVLTEGFPINPIVVTRLREKLRSLKIGVTEDTAPLAVLELTTLEFVEAYQEAGGKSLPQLLD